MCHTWSELQGPNVLGVQVLIQTLTTPLVCLCPMQLVSFRPIQSHPPRWCNHFAVCACHVRCQTTRQGIHVSSNRHPTLQLCCWHRHFSCLWGGDNFSNCLLGSHSLLPANSTQLHRTETTESSGITLTLV